MPDRHAIAAVILAAGRSLRFGGDKLVQPLALNGNSLPLAAHSLMSWLQAFDQVTVVIRPQDRALRGAIEPVLARASAIHWVEAADAGQGMGHSLAAGVAANQKAAGWMIGLADMPLLPSEAIIQVQAALAAGAPLVVPEHDGKRGHPVGFGSGYRDELLALSGDTGARYLLQRDAAFIRKVEIAHLGIHADIDLPADLERFKPGGV